MSGFQMGRRPFDQDEPWPVDPRPDQVRVHLKVARDRLMRAAREADEVHATSTHHNILCLVTALDDTVDDFNKHMGFLQMIEDSWAIGDDA